MKRRSNSSMAEATNLYCAIPRTGRRSVRAASARAAAPPRSPVGTPVRRRFTASAASSRSVNSSGPAADRHRLGEGEVRAARRPLASSSAFASSSRAVDRPAGGADAPALVRDVVVVDHAVTVARVELERPMHQAFRRRKVHRHDRIGLVERDHEAPSGTGPVQQRDVVLLHSGERGTRAVGERLAHSGMVDFESAQAVLECASVESHGSIAKVRRARQIGILDVVGFGREIDVGVLREARSRRKQEPLVSRRRLEESLDRLERERKRVADQLGVVVARVAGAPAGEGVAELAGRPSADRTPRRPCEENAEQQQADGSMSRDGGHESSLGDGARSPSSLPASWEW